PDPHGSVVAAAREPRAVGGEVDGGDSLRMDEVAQKPAVGEPPDLHRAVDAARRERSRVWAERDLPELAGEARERVLDAGPQRRLGGGPGYGKDREERRPDPD